MNCRIDPGRVDPLFSVLGLPESGVRAAGLPEGVLGRKLHSSDCCAAALVPAEPGVPCYVDVNLATGFWDPAISTEGPKGE